MPSTITALTMPAGLKAILDINLDFITNNKNPLITSTQDLKDDDGNQLEPVYTSGPIKELIEGHLDSKFHSTPIINFDVKLFTWNFSPGGASQDSLYNTFGWEKKQKLIEFLVDVQLLNGVDSSSLTGYTYDIDSTTQKTLFEEHLSGKLSYEAVILRSNVLSWIYERMMNDYQAEIDAWNGWFDQYPAGLDFGVSIFTLINNLISSSQSQRTLVKFDGKSSYITNQVDNGDSEEYDQENIDYRYLKFDDFKDDNLYKDYYTSYLSNVKSVKKVLDEIANEIKNPHNSLNNSISTSDSDDMTDIYLTRWQNYLEVTARRVLGDNRTLDDYVSLDSSAHPYNELFSYVGNILGKHSNDYGLIMKNSLTEKKCTCVISLQLCEAIGNVRETIEVSYSRAESYPQPSVMNLAIYRCIYKMVNQVIDQNPTILDKIRNVLYNFSSTICYAIPDLLETSKLFLEWRRSQIFYGLDTVKGDFERLADVTNTVPGIMQRTMSYLNSGHYFDVATNVRSIGPKLITLTNSEIKENSVRLSWDPFPNATEYYVFKNGVYEEKETAPTITTTINELEPGTPHSFYINAVDASGIVLAQSQTIMITTKDFSLEISLTADSVDLNWSNYNNPDAIKYKVYQDNTDVTNNSNYTNKTKTINSLTSATYEFYVEALDVSNTVLAKTNTVKVTISAS